MTILVTGNAGFIGSNFVFDWLLGVKLKIVSNDVAVSSLAVVEALA